MVGGLVTCCDEMTTDGVYELRDGFQETRKGRLEDHRTMDRLILEIVYGTRSATVSLVDFVINDEHHDMMFLAK